ncbi:hypothetical protein BB558_006656 [Smittium angustum]|uniref:Uncharacterized protein n=1 Tax=Smittium angustum TaxID=133377 RepID=A0A2U1IXA6_SMIAN|nr:hypothetical protein BB558_006656 [Smittium angustum]
MNKLTGYQIISKIFILSQNPEVRFVSREFYEISTLDSIRADFLLHKLGKVNAITVQNKNFIPYPNIFKKQELVLNLLKKGATPDTESAHLLFQISVEREWENIVEYLLNLFREATWEDFRLAIISGRPRLGYSQQHIFVSIDTPIEQTKFYVPVVNNTNYDYFNKFDRKVFSNPITYIDMGFKKSFGKAVSKGNANIVKLLLNAHKILPKLELNDPHTKIATHHKVIMDSLKLDKLCDMFEKCGFELLELFYKYEPELSYINGSIFSEFCKRGNMKFVKFMTENKMGLERNRHYSRVYDEILERDSGNIFNLPRHHKTFFSIDNGIALKNAIENGQIDILKYIVEKGTDINAANQECLIIACEKGQIDILKYLIEKGADVHAASKGCLNSVIENGQIDILKYLIEKGADVHAVDDYYLGIACAKDHLSLVEYLFKNGANIRTDNDYALRWASSKGHINFVKYLIENGADVHAYDNNSLKKACENGHLNVFKYLIQKGADIHAENDYSFRIACAKDNLSLVECLVKNGANIRADSDYALRWASSKGHINFVKYLIENGADVHAYDNNALKQGCWAGNLEVVKYLIEKGADIHAENDYSFRISCLKCHLSLIEYLVKNGANIRADSDYALRWASSKGYINFVKYLVENGADVHANNDEALRVAHENGNLDLSTI